MEEFNLVLDGFGVRAMHSISGTLKEIERSVKIKQIAGTSAGFFVGSLISAGFSPKERAELIRTLPVPKEMFGLWFDLFFKGRLLSVPLKVVLSDLKKHDGVVFDVNEKNLYCALYITFYGCGKFSDGILASSFKLDLFGKDKTPTIGVCFEDSVPSPDTSLQALINLILLRRQSDELIGDNAKNVILPLGHEIDRGHPLEEALLYFEGVRAAREFFKDTVEKKICVRICFN